MEAFTFRAVPYCVWANREAGEMRVWMQGARNKKPGFPEKTWFRRFLLLASSYFSYGSPSAAGGMASPTTPARTTIVTR